LYDLKKYFPVPAAHTIHKISFPIQGCSTNKFRVCADCDKCKAG